MTPAALAKPLSPLVRWQYEQIEAECSLLAGHVTDPDCPCESDTENCIRKHLLTIEALAKETYPMSITDQEKQKMADLADQARSWRKDIEQYTIGSGSPEPANPEQPIRTEQLTTGAGEVRIFKEKGEFHAGSFRTIKPDEQTMVLVGCPVDRASWQNQECICQDTGERGCTELHSITRFSSSKKKIGQAETFESTTGVLDPYGSRCRDPKTGQWIYSEACGYEPAGITTTALGMDGITRYEFEFKIISLDKLIISHDPFTFTPNPNYPEELQPRLRERAATKVQVEKIAANLEPDAVITDFHVIDRGTPIVGPDLVVEAGNGRVMGIIRAAADYPDKYAAYKDSLRERVHDYGLSAKDIDSIEKPVLIRVRISDVDRSTFTQEANQAATIAPSAIENARVDAQKITMGMLAELVVGENESLEDALRAPKNQAFAKRFLATLPENVQAALVDAQGYLNRDGVHRMAMAVFVSAFQGDPGLRLAEKAFESVDMDVRNTVNSIARSLGPIAQAEALTRSGDRDPSLSIGDDLAQTVNVYSAIKRNPALTVEKYMAQEQIFARELTPFQESILKVLEEYKRSPRKLAGIFTAYAESVIAAPPPAQAALIPGAEITKEELWDSAVTRFKE